MKYRNFRSGLLLTAIFAFASCVEDGGLEVPSYWVLGTEDVVSSAPSWSNSLPTVSEPSWGVQVTGDATSPNWTAPDAQDYPSSMTAVLRLSSFLENYASDNDKLAAFIGDEVRGVASRINVEGVDLYFVQVKAKDDETGNVQFRYYNDKRKTISVSTSVPYLINKVFGTATNPEIISFTDNNGFESVMEVKMTVKSDDFTPSSADLIGAFIGDECRGITHYGSSIAVCGNKGDEEVSFLYYSAETKAIYQATSSMAFKGDNIVKETLTFIPQNCMVMYGKLGSPLSQIFNSSADKMGAFVGGAAVGEGVFVGNNTYRFVIPGKAEEEVSFKYYNGANTYVFDGAETVTLQHEIKGSKSSPLALNFVTEDKHPLTMTISGSVLIGRSSQMSSSDIIAAMVDGQCRGLANVTNEDTFNLVVRGTLGKSETIKLMYYCKGNTTIYSYGGTFKFKAGEVISQDFFFDKKE